MLNSLNCVIQCLEQTISPDKKILADAQLMLEKCAEENVGQFISNMSIVLADTKKSPVARQAAGLQLKNCLTSRDVSLKKKYQRRWANLPEKSRNDVRDRLFSSLGTEKIFPSCAAQCIAYIGAAELLLETEPSSEITSLKNLLSELSSIVIRPANGRRKEAALDSIACISQEINPEVLVNFYKLILDPILVCMGDRKSTDRIRLAAARALLNSLECIHPCFETEEGRDMVMQVVCDATQSTVVEESVIWLEILAKIGSFYYHHLMKYMESAIVPITLKAILSTDSNISLQGIEFWSSLAEIEFDLASGVYDPTLADIPSSFYAEKALPKLVPVLMSVLIAWQDLPNDIDDLEEWTPFKGAGSCLLLLAQCCSTKIDVYITSHVSNFIESSNWRQRHAALWAVNSILKEMDPKRASSAMLPFMASFWKLTFDGKSAKVRHAALMLINRIFQVCPSLIPTALKPLIIGLLEHLDDADYRVAVVACKSLSLLVNKLSSQKNEDSAQPTTSSLSRYYKRIIEKLLQCCGTSPKDLKFAAYLALVDVLPSSPDDCYGFVKSTIQTLIEKLRDEVTDSENVFTYLELSRAIKKLKADEIQIRHEFMCELISLLQSGVIKEDVFLATSTTISFFPRNELTMHLPALITYFKSAVDLPDACPMIVQLIGDLFRASGTESLPYLDYFCAKMFDILARNEVATKLRSDCIATLMDMARSVGMEHFQQHIGLTLDQLQYATSITVKKDPEHEELQEIMMRFYNVLFGYACDQASNESREWTSQPSLMEECLVGLLEFLVAIVDEDSSEMIMLASAEFVRIILEKLGTTRTMKFLDCNSNLDRLLLAAADLADSCE